MDREQMLLLLLMEECSELQHAASKAIRFGLDENKIAAILKELDDLKTSFFMLNIILNIEGLGFEYHFPNLDSRVEKVESYIQESINLGRMNDE